MKDHTYLDSNRDTWEDGLMVGRDKATEKWTKRTDRWNSYMEERKEDTCIMKKDHKDGMTIVWEDMEDTDRQVKEKTEITTKV